jgi:uncharacterized protein
MEKSFLEIKFIDKKINYDGSQLDHHFIYKNFNIKGDAAISFIGKCNVKKNNIVDIEDILAKKTIKADSMLHFIIELFNKELLFGSAIQSVFISEIQNELLEKGFKVKKYGDDLYVENRKLSISIASKSSVSVLIHIGVNIINKGTPVETEALKTFGINEKAFAKAVLKRFNKEYTRVMLATTKVIPRD